MKLYKKQKQIQQVLMKKGNLQNKNILYLANLFINYYSIIDSH